MLRSCLPALSWGVSLKRGVMAMLFSFPPSGVQQLVLNDFVGLACGCGSVKMMIAPVVSSICPTNVSLRSIFLIDAGQLQGWVRGWKSIRGPVGSCCTSVSFIAFIRPATKWKWIWRRQRACA